MQALQETTQWDAPNHIYITNDSRDRLLGYVVNGVLTEFAKALKFDARRRKFNEIPNTWIADNSPARTVTGSNGKVYTISERNGREVCNCPGFQFRGRCKHIAA